ncbi:hypothetical protein ERJ75_000064400 [Trypanosoma vivax]|uniref:Uncharacterized protein n=1 Tax=Trypanosoma vivax (strain Y486) TaxID=1055687 RepID=F9WU16_TRYVY|nr:hypothetical protein TRVL_02390 [Trypanosoma vivax]KAH8620725.1 hypothetical protein ERJ75_000064400 [Trypanosoma vivax]CCD21062.1 hypothetical protein TvY486_0039650 [Trypanosoma vivax Y486]|eukprot:CCD21062.1 hypothetical protein TvY486_0039650 [Trypanosoma vivax Y486]
MYKSRSSTSVGSGWVLLEKTSARSESSSRSTAPQDIASGSCFVYIKGEEENILSARCVTPVQFSFPGSPSDDIVHSEWSLLCASKSGEQSQCNSPSSVSTVECAVVTQTRAGDTEETRPCNGTLFVSTSESSHVSTLPVRQWALVAVGSWQPQSRSILRSGVCSTLANAKFPYSATFAPSCPMRLGELPARTHCSDRQPMIPFTFGERLPSDGDLATESTGSRSPLAEFSYNSQDSWSGSDAILKGREAVTGGGGGGDAHPSGKGVDNGRAYHSFFWYEEICHFIFASPFVVPDCSEAKRWSERHPAGESEFGDLDEWATVGEWFFANVTPLVMYTLYNIIVFAI